MKPSVGRIVHYFPRGEEFDPTHPSAAIITDVNRHPQPDGVLEEDTFLVSLRVFTKDGGGEYPLNPNFSPVPRRGHWSWPPRV